MDSQSILIIALVSVTIGYFAGLLISNFKTERSNTTPTDSTQEEKSPVIEVARLVRTTPNAGISIQIDGKIITRVNQLNGNQRKTIEETMVELLRWLGYSTTQIPRSQTGEPVPAEQKPAPESTGESSLPVAAGGQAPAQTPIQPQIRGTGPLVAPAAQAKPAKPNAPVVKSIVKQIDEILQNHIIGTDLDNRGIRLTETITGGVVVHIGLESFPSIDEVPDDTIRTLIRQCVAEWETTNHPR